MTLRHRRNAARRGRRLWRGGAALKRWPNAVNYSWATNGRRDMARTAPWRRTTTLSKRKHGAQHLISISETTTAFVIRCKQRYRRRAVSRHSTRGIMARRRRAATSFFSHTAYISSAMTRRLIGRRLLLSPKVTTMYINHRERRRQRLNMHHVVRRRATAALALLFSASPRKPHYALLSYSHRRSHTAQPYNSNAVCWR